MNVNWLLLVTAYIFLSALVAYPHGSKMAYQVQHPEVAQVTEALKEAGWEDFEIHLPYKVTISGPPIYWVRFSQLARDEVVVSVGLLLGEGAPQRAADTYEIMVANEQNPDPGVDIVAFQLSDQAAIILKDLPDRINETARIIQDYNKPAQLNRAELWQMLLRYGKTEARLYDYFPAFVRDIVLLLLEPGRQLLLAMLLLLPLSAMGAVFQIWRALIFLVPGAYLLIHLKKWISRSEASV